MTSSSHITAKQVYARATWISSLTGIELEITKDSTGWTVYHVDKTQGGRRLSELFFADSTYTAFTALKAIYNFVTILKPSLTESERESAASDAVKEAIGIGMLEMDY